MDDGAGSRAILPSVSMLDEEEKLNRTNPDRLVIVLNDIKELALEYRKLTGRSLGITGEVAEYEVCRILKLTLARGGQAGYDAKDEDGKTYQIKGRCIQQGGFNGHRIGKILPHHKFDAVLVVIMDANLDATHVYQAERDDVIKLIGAMGENIRGIPVPRFVKIAKLVWP